MQIVKRSSKKKAKVGNWVRSSPFVTRQILPWTPLFICIHLTPVRAWDTFEETPGELNISNSLFSKLDILENLSGGIIFNYFQFFSIIFYYFFIVFNCFQLFSIIFNCFQLFSIVFNYFQMLSIVFNYFVQFVFNYFQLLSIVFHFFSIFKTFWNCFQFFHLFSIFQNSNILNWF